MDPHHPLQIGLPLIHSYSPHPHGVFESSGRAISGASLQNVMNCIPFDKCGHITSGNVNYNSNTSSVIGSGSSSGTVTGGSGSGQNNGITDVQLSLSVPSTHNQAITLNQQLQNPNNLNANNNNQGGPNNLNPQNQSQQVPNISPSAAIINLTSNGLPGYGSGLVMGTSAQTGQNYQLRSTYNASTARKVEFREKVRNAERIEKIKNDKIMEAKDLGELGLFNSSTNSTVPLFINALENLTKDDDVNGATGPDIDNFGQLSDITGQAINPVSQCVATFGNQKLTVTASGAVKTVTSDQCSDVNGADSDSTTQVYDYTIPDPKNVDNQISAQEEDMLHKEWQKKIQELELLTRQDKNLSSNFNKKSETSPVTSPKGKVQKQKPFLPKYELVTPVTSQTNGNQESPTLSQVKTTALPHIHPKSELSRFNAKYLEGKALIDMMRKTLMGLKNNSNESNNNLNLNESSESQNQIDSEAQVPSEVRLKAEDAVRELRRKRVLKEQELQQQKELEEAQAGTKVLNGEKSQGDNSTGAGGEKSSDAKQDGTAADGKDGGKDSTSDTGAVAVAAGVNKDKTSDTNAAQAALLKKVHAKKEDVLAFLQVLLNSSYNLTTTSSEDNELLSSKDPNQLPLMHGITRDLTSLRRLNSSIRREVDAAKTKLLSHSTTTSSNFNPNSDVSTNQTNIQINQNNLNSLNNLNKDNINLLIANNNVANPLSSGCLDGKKNPYQTMNQLRGVITTCLDEETRIVKEKILRSGIETDVAGGGGSGGGKSLSKDGNDMENDIQMDGNDENNAIKDSDTVTKSTSSGKVDTTILLHNTKPLSFFPIDETNIDNPSGLEEQSTSNSYVLTASDIIRRKIENHNFIESNILAEIFETKLITAVLENREQKQLKEQYQSNMESNSIQYVQGLPSWSVYSKEFINKGMDPKSSLFKLHAMYHELTEKSRLDMDLRKKIQYRKKVSDEISGFKDKGLQKLKQLETLQSKFVKFLNEDKINQLSHQGITSANVIDIFGSSKGKSDISITTKTEVGGGPVTSTVTAAVAVKQPPPQVGSSLFSKNTPTSAAVTTMAKAAGLQNNLFSSAGGPGTTSASKSGSISTNQTTTQGILGQLGAAPQTSNDSKGTSSTTQQQTTTTQALSSQQQTIQTPASISAQAHAAALGRNTTSSTTASNNLLLLSESESQSADALTLPFPLKKLYERFAVLVEHGFDKSIRVTIHSNVRSASVTMPNLPGGPGGPGTSDKLQSNQSNFPSGAAEKVVDYDNLTGAVKSVEKIAVLKSTGNSINNPGGPNSNSNSANSPKSSNQQHQQQQNQIQQVNNQPGLNTTSISLFVKIPEVRIEIFPKGVVPPSFEEEMDERRKLLKRRRDEISRIKSSIGLPENFESLVSSSSDSKAGSNNSNMNLTSKVQQDTTTTAPGPGLKRRRRNQSSDFPAIASPAGESEGGGDSTTNNNSNNLQTLVSQYHQILSTLPMIPELPLTQTTTVNITGPITLSFKLSMHEAKPPAPNGREKERDRLKEQLLVEENSTKQAELLKQFQRSGDRLRAEQVRVEREIMNKVMGENHNMGQNGGGIISIALPPNIFSPLDIFNRHLDQFPVCVSVEPIADSNKNANSIWDPSNFEKLCTNNSNSIGTMEANLSKNVIVTLASSTSNNSTSPRSTESLSMTNLSTATGPNFKSFDGKTDVLTYRWINSIISADVSALDLVQNIRESCF